METDDGLSSYRRDWEEMFIHAYESHPVLWDRSHSNYGNYRERVEALRQLLPAYRKIKPTAGLADVKRKINVLRSNYRRELKKIIMSGNGQQKRSWKFECLRFLDKGESGYGIDEEITIDEQPITIKQEPINQEATTTETTPQISQIKPGDEFQIFGEFVASELRNLKSVGIQRKLKLVIQRAIIEYTELDLNGLASPK